MVRSGRNAGGTWDREHRKAEYHELPEKESLLWRRYSQVIYWWTATEESRSRAYRITYNGYVDSFDKPGWGDYWAFRCVCAPGRFEKKLATKASVLLMRGSGCSGSRSAAQWKIRRFHGQWPRIRAASRRSMKAAKIPRA